MSDVLWRVVGGGDKGGIVVRAGQGLASEQLPDRLTTDSVVKELMLVGERLNYLMLTGTGPESGWVSLKLKDKALLVREGEQPSEPVRAAEATETNGKSLRGPLPLIPRNVGFPSLAELPEKRRQKFPEPVRSPLVRLFVYYGVGDSFMDWLGFVAGAPAWSEVAVYECRGHGGRGEEAWDNDMERRLEDAWVCLQPALEQHAPGGPADGAPFVFLAHSSGAQLACLVGKRVREELGLEPSAFFVVDRPPPTIKAISDVGYEMLCSDPSDFFTHFNPSIVEMMHHGKTGNTVAAKRAECWEKGMHLTQEFNLDEGYHQFDCPIFVFIAMQIFEADKAFARKSMSEQEREQHLRRAKVTQSAKDSAADWDTTQYGLWKKWTTLGRCEVRRVMTDHSSLRFHPEMLDVLWKQLRTIVDEPGPAVEQG